MQAIGWIFVSLAETERRRAFDPDMPADINTGSNIYALIDEAYRTTGGDLGNLLMAGLPAQRPSAPTYPAIPA